MTRIFLYESNGIITIHAKDVYMNPTSSSIEIDIPKAKGDSDYIDMFGERIEYVAASSYKKNLEEDEYSAGIVSIKGGLNTLRANEKGYHTFMIQYPIDEI